GVMIKKNEFWLVLMNIFFFQAEDGIRDSSVTGVQTCALPISVRRRFWQSKSRWRRLCQNRLRTGVPRRAARLGWWMRAGFLRPGSGRLIIAQRFSAGIIDFIYLLSPL